MWKTDDSVTPSTSLVALVCLFNLWRACFKKKLAKPCPEEYRRGKQFDGCCKGLSHNRILFFTLHSAGALRRVPLSWWMCSLLFFSQQWAGKSHYLTDADLTSSAWLLGEGTITCLLGAITGDNVKALIITGLAAHVLVEWIINMHTHTVLMWCYRRP